MVSGVLACGLFAGCGGSNSAMPSSPAASTSTMDPQEVGKAFNKLPFTKPGTTLPLGKDAIVRYDDPLHHLGAVRIQLVKVRKGSATDSVMKDLKGGLGKIPWYLEWKITGEVAADKIVDSDPTRYTVGWTAAGKGAGWILLGWPDAAAQQMCMHVNSPIDFAQGKSYTTCTVAVADPDESVIGAAWLGDTSTVMGASGRFGNRPIIWKS